MTVSRILDEKGRHVMSIAPERSIDDAARLMSDKRIGAVLVTNPDGAVRGILSERDIVRALAARGAAALNEPVSAVMTTKVVTCTPDTRVEEVMERMTAGRFRHLPVIHDGRLAGLVSIGDVVKHRLAEIEAETEALKEYIHST